MVIVVVKIDDKDLTFRVIIPTVSACSSIITIKDKADSWDGNPYLVYGDDVARFVGCDKHDVSISVARCDSGEI